MKDSSRLRQLLYLSIGWASLTKKKIEEVIDEMIANNELSREEGARIMAEVSEKAEEMRAFINEKKAAVIDKIYEKSHLTKKEVEERVDTFLKRPLAMKRYMIGRLDNMIDDLTDQRHKVKDHLEDFINEIIAIEQEVESTVEAIGMELRSNAEKSKNWVNQLIEKVHELRSVTKINYDLIVTDLMHKLNMATEEEVKKINKRLDKLEARTY